MKRREHSVQDGNPPAKLRRYKAADWGGGVDAPQLWYDALEEWREEHDDSVSVDPDSEWPDVPFDPSTI